MKEFLFDGNEVRIFGSGEQILNGVQRLGDSELPIEGCILNGTRRPVSDGYGYGYGCGEKKNSAFAS